MFELFIGILFIVGFVLAIIGYSKELNSHKGKTTYFDHGHSYHRQNHHDHHLSPRNHTSSKSNTNSSGMYRDPFDNHWETSFDWKDEDHDGYDDRDDGFWGGKEF